KLRPAAGDDADARADSLGVRRTAAEPHREPVRGVSAVVAVEPRRALVARDEDVEIAVAIVVEEHDAASLERVVEPELRAPLGERPVAVRDEGARGIRREQLRGGIPGVPAVGLVDVQVTVVIEVAERRRPAPVAVAYAGGVGRVFEGSVAVAAVE